MLSKRNVATIAIMAIALTLGSAGLVTPIGQVAHAATAIEYGMLTGLITSILPPGSIISTLQAVR
jgi:hypothetical protein